MFRKQINDKMTKTQTQMKKLQLELEEFKNFNVAYNKEVSNLEASVTWVERAQLKILGPQPRFPDLGLQVPKHCQ